MSSATLGSLYLVLTVLALVVGIAWVLLPFAMFGIKPLLRELIGETRALREAMAPANPATPPKRDDAVY